MLERLRGAWDSYKLHIVAATLMILSAVAGLSYQTVSADRARRAAGDALFAVMRAAENENFAAAENALSRIDGEEFPQLRGMALAVMASAGAADAAEKLREAATRETDDGLRLLLVLRRAETLINSGETGAAIALLEEHETDAAPAMQMLFAERRGDAHYVAGHPRAARDAYLRARDAAAESFSSHIPALNLKIGASVSLPSSAPNSESDAAPETAS